jgi:hypothetical protein
MTTVHNNNSVKSMSKRKIINTCPSIGSYDLTYEIITFGGKNKNLGIIYVLQKSLVQKND